jgi:hypothetical protein
MTTGAGDTISVRSADTVSSIVQTKDFSIGSIIPLSAENTVQGSKYSSLPGLVAGYIPKSHRIDGQPLPASPVSPDFSFILLSVLLLILTLLIVAGRKSIIRGFANLRFKKQRSAVPPGTSEVLAWEPIFRNVFSIGSISLFAAISLLYTGLVSYDHVFGSVILTAIISGSFLAALLLRHLVCIIIASITGWKNAFREYMNVVYNGWFADAVFLFILNCVFLFSPLRNILAIIITGLSFTAILLIIRMLKLLVIFRDRHISNLYFILYLCALEILPVLIFLKIIGVF